MVLPVGSRWFSMVLNELHTIKIHVLLIQVRMEFMDTSVAELLQSGSYDPFKAWNETILKGRYPNRVVSPLMSSLQCYEYIQNYFPGGLSFSIEGRDILDVDPMRNPLFYSYNHVLVPYCSSDVWLGEQTGNTEAVDEGTLQCKCLTSSSISNPCFNYNPQSPNLQFTFRGKIIYQSVIQQLLTDHYMMEAERVLLSGSSRSYQPCQMDSE